MCTELAIKYNKFNLEGNANPFKLLLHLLRNDVSCSSIRCHIFLTWCMFGKHVSCAAGAKLFVALKTPPSTSPGTQTCVSEPQTALYAHGTQIKP